MHFPAEQVPPAPHEMPQPPQLLGSVDGSTHASWPPPDGQAVLGAVQVTQPVVQVPPQPSEEPHTVVGVQVGVQATQLPLMQAWPVPHAMPQLPQSALVDWRSTHWTPLALGQLVSPGPQKQVPPWHPPCGPHDLSQPPQLFESKLVSVHLDPHSTCGAMHEQLLVQVPPQPSGEPHVAVGEQLGVQATQAELEQTWPAPQAVVQLPQCWLSVCSFTHCAPDADEQSE